MEDLLAVLRRDQADGAAVEPALPVALVEHDGAVDGEDAGLVAVFTPSRTPSKTRRGWSRRAAGFVMEGDAKQNTSVLQMSSAPVPIGRSSPTMPVSARRGGRGPRAVVRFHLDAGVVFVKGDDAALSMVRNGRNPCRRALADPRSSRS